MKVKKRYLKIQIISDKDRCSTKCPFLAIENYAYCHLFKSELVDPDYIFTRRCTQCLGQEIIEKEVISS